MSIDRKNKEVLPYNSPFSHGAICTIQFFLNSQKTTIEMLSLFSACKSAVFTYNSEFLKKFKKKLLIFKLFHLLDDACIIVGLFCLL